MPIPDIRLRDYPVGPLRDKFVVTIGTADYTLAQGFICEAVNATAAPLSITYRTLEGSTDQTETIAANTSRVLGIGNHPILLSIVRGSSTITTIQVGRL